LRITDIFYQGLSTAIESRTCKHLRNYLGEDFEKDRLGGTMPVRAVSSRARSSASNIESAGEGAAESTEPGLLLAHSWDGQTLANRYR